MANLLVYIPTLNERHIAWLEKHPRSSLFLISQSMAESFLPRLARNMAALPTEIMIDIFQSSRTLDQRVCVGSVSEFAAGSGDPDLRLFIRKHWVVADEDVSKAVAEKYLTPAGCTFQLEGMWARWDMSAVHKKQPIIADVTVSSSVLDHLRMDQAIAKATESPDWWRQIGAVAFDFDGNRLAVTCNTHMPNEYETYMFGDPRLNVDAGQKGVYCALHAERAVIALCAKQGIALLGSSLYVTTFPCEDCAREIAFAGVKRLFFREGYSVLNAQEVLRSYGVEIVQVIEDPVFA